VVTMSITAIRDILLTRYSNSIQTLQTFISVIITFVITVPKGSFLLVQIYKIFNFVHKSHVCCDVNYYVMKPSCAAAAVRCPAYCQEIGYDAYDASKKLTRHFFRRSLVVVVSQSNLDHFRRSRMRRGIVVS